MTGSLYRILPEERRIEPVAWPPVDIDASYPILRRWANAPLELHVIDAAGVGLSESRERIKAPLVLLTGRQSAAPEIEADSYRVGRRVFTGISLLGCRIRGADRLYQFPTAPTGLLRTTLDLTEAQAIVEWHRTPQEVERDKRFDEPMLRDYCKRLAEAAEAACGNKGPGGVLRVYSTDLDGEVSGTFNVLPGDWKKLRRWALDAFDRHENALHEWCLRDVGAYGSSAETRPVQSLATIAEAETPGALVLHAPDGNLYLTPGASPWLPDITPRRLPFPGLPFFRQIGDARGDRLVKIEEPKL